MSGRQQVSFDALDGLAKSLAKASENIQSILDDLDAKVAPLATQWTGEAANAYQSAKASWTADMAHTNAVLSAASSAVKAGRRTYANVENGFVEQL